jgi:hypothetical protein
MSFLKIKENVLEQVAMKLLRNQLDFRNGHLLLVLANSLTNFLDQTVQRGKQDNKNFYDLTAKGLLNLSNLRNQTNVVHFDLVKNLETFF